MYGYGAGHCCNGIVSLVRYDADNGDILWQRRGEPHSPFVRWDNAAGRIWYASGGAGAPYDTAVGLYGRDINGVLRVQTSDIQPSNLTVRPAGGVLIYGTIPANATPRLYFVSADGTTITPLTDLPNYTGVATELSSGNIVVEGMSCYATDGTVVWNNPSAGGNAVFVDSADRILSYGGRLIGGGDGTHLALVGDTGLGIGNTGSHAGTYWGGCSFNSGIIGLWLADDDGDPLLWKTDVPHEPGSACVDADGSIYTTDYSGPNQRNIVRKYSTAGVLLWEQVGPRNQGNEITSIVIDGDGHVVVGSMAGLRITRSEWIN